MRDCLPPGKSLSPLVSTLLCFSRSARSFLNAVVPPGIPLKVATIGIAGYPVAWVVNWCKRGVFGRGYASATEESTIV